MGRSNTWANEKWKRREQVILFRCWLNAGRPTNDSFGTLRFASYVRRGGRDCGGPECLAAGGKRRKKKKKKKWRNALKLRRQGRSSIQHIWIYFKKFFLLFFFFLDFSFSFLSSSSLHIFSFLFFRSFVRSFVFFFRDWNVSVGLFPTFFPRSPRSFLFLRVFPFLNSHTTMTWISGAKFNRWRRI